MELEPGAYFDHGVRTVDQLAIGVIGLALGLGWQDGDAAELFDCAAPGRPAPEWVSAYGYANTAEGVSEALADVAFDASDSATDYINEHHTPEGYWAGNDGECGAWGIWAIEDSEEGSL